MMLIPFTIFLQEYARSFWKPLTSGPSNYAPTFYHLQFGAELKSPLLDKQNSPIENLIGKMVQKNDFMNVR